MGVASRVSLAFGLCLCLTAGAQAQSAPPSPADGTPPTGTERVVNAEAEPADALGTPHRGGQRTGEAGPADVEATSHVPDGAPAPDVAAAPPPTAAPHVSETDGLVYYEVDPATRLAGWLRVHDERNRFSRIFSGVALIVLGAAVITGGVWGSTFLEPVLIGTFGGLSALVGAMNIGFGIGLLQLTMPQEDRYARWNAVAADGATNEEISAFAGELYGEVTLARFTRKVSVVLGLAMAAGGAAAMGLTAALEEDELGRVLGFSLGGTYVLLGGLLALISALVESPVERDWARYERGLSPQPDSSGAMFVLTPTLGPDVAGMAVDGRF